MGCGWSRKIPDKRAVYSSLQVPANLSNSSEPNSIYDSDHRTVVQWVEREKIADAQEKFVNDGTIPAFEKWSVERAQHSLHKLKVAAQQNLHFHRHRRHMEHQRHVHSVHPL